MVDDQNTGEDIRGGHFPVTYWEAKLCLPDPNSILLLPVDGSVTAAFELGGDHQFHRENVARCTPPSIHHSIRNLEFRTSLAMLLAAT